MAFTTTERATIRRYLGVPALYFLEYPALEQAMTAVPLNSVDDENQIRTILQQLAAIDFQIDNAANNNLVASQVDEIKLRGPEQIDALKDVGRGYIKKLTITFEFAPLSDYYSGGDLGGWIAIG